MNTAVADPKPNRLADKLARLLEPCEDHANAIESTVERGMCNADIIAFEEVRHYLRHDEAFVHERLIDMTLGEIKPSSIRWMHSSAYIDTFPFKALLVDRLVDEDANSLCSFIFNRDCMRCIKSRAEDLVEGLALNVKVDVEHLHSLVLLLQLTKDKPVLGYSSIVNIIKKVSTQLKEASDLDGLEALIKAVSDDQIEESSIFSLLFAAFLETSDRRKAINLMQLIGHLLSRNACDTSILTRSRVMNALFRWLHGIGAECYYALCILHSASRLLTGHSREVFMKNVVPEVELLFYELEVLVVCVQYYVDAVQLIHALLDGHAVSQDSMARIEKRLQLNDHRYSAFASIYVFYADLCKIKPDKNLFSAVYIHLSSAPGTRDVLARLLGRTFGCQIEWPSVSPRTVRKSPDYSRLIKDSLAAADGAQANVALFESELAEAKRREMELGATVERLSKEKEEEVDSQTLLLKQLAEQQEQVRDLSSKCQEYEAKGQLLQSELEAKRDQAHECKQDAKALREAMSEERKLAKEALSKLEQTLANANSEASTYARQIKECKEKLESIHAINAKCISDLALLKDENAKLAESLRNALFMLESEKKAHAAALKEIKNRTQLDRLKIQRELEELSLNSKQQSDELDYLRAELANSRNSELALKSEFLKMKAQLGLKEEQLKRDRLEMDRLLEDNSAGLFSSDVEIATEF